MALRTVVTTALLTVILASPIFAAKPLGYERYSHGAVSTVFTEKSLKEVYEYWARPLVFNGPTSGVTHSRLIDIEAHVTQKKHKQKVTFSGIEIRNEKDDELDSWLQTGVTINDLFEFWSVLEMEFIPLDIERYYLNDTTFFAIIWQRNTHKSRWDILLDVSADALRSAEGDGYRIVDFDHFTTYKSVYNVISNHFDAIIVENTGGNYVHAQWLTLYGEYTSSGGGLRAKGLFLPKGSIPIDIENVFWPNGYLEVGALCYAIVVHNTDEEVDMIGLTTDLHHYNYVGRLIDLEGGPEPYPHNGWTSSVNEDYYWDGLYRNWKWKP